MTPEPVDRRYYCGDPAPHDAHSYRAFIGGSNTETLSCDGVRERAVSVNV